MPSKYHRVYLTALGYELGPEVVTSAELEERLAPVGEVGGQKDDEQQFENLGRLQIHAAAAQP